MKETDFFSSTKELTLRFSHLEDAPLLIEWLKSPDVLQWFPMYDMREIEDAAKIWTSYSRIHAGITALWQGEPCGMANLYIQPFKKLKHTCLLSIIVKEGMRGRGIGRTLLENLIRLARENFDIEILHLEVYEGNPAKRLYERVGFVEYGKQTHFIKEAGRYTGKVFMQKDLRFRNGRS